MPAAKRTKVFTHQGVQALKCIEGKPFTDIAEGAGRDKGFGVRVYASGAKMFFYKYRLEGRLRYMSLGAFPCVKEAEALKASLEEAHKKYREAKEKVKKGIDPRTEKEPQPAPKPEKEAEAANNGKSTTTFGQVIDNYIDVCKRAEHSSGSIRSNEYTFNADNGPRKRWGEQAASSITDTDVLSLLKEYVKRGKPGQALNVLKACRSAWEYADSGKLIWEPNPFADINLKYVLPEMVAKPRQRFLTNNEILTVWEGLSSPPGSESVRRALQLILVTAQRPGEVAGMHRSEITGHWWTIPTERTKYKKGPYRVYLTETALKIIGDHEGYIFPSPEDDGPVSRDSLSGFLHLERKNNEWPKLKHYGIPQWQPHDLRRTVRTNLPELGVMDEHAEQVLNHEKEKLIGTYNLYKYDPEKKEAMERWEKKLLSIIDVPNVSSPAPAPVPVISKRLLSNKELAIIWNRLSCYQSADATCRALKLILLTGQSPGYCAAMHRSDVVECSDALWWKVNGNKIFLSKQAISVIGPGDGYSFASRNSHVKIGTLSFFILRAQSFGIPKWTPVDLQYTVAIKIGELGASRKVTEALEHGLSVNEWELRFWLEKWAEVISTLSS